MTTAARLAGINGRTRSRRRRRAIGIAGIAGAAAVGLSACIPVNVPQERSVTFEHPDGVVQFWVVPEGVTAVHIDAYGAQGGSGGPGLCETSSRAGGPGGLGGHVGATVPVEPGSSLLVVAPESGENGAGREAVDVEAPDAVADGGGPLSNGGHGGRTGQPSGDFLVLASAGGGGGGGAALVDPVDGPEFSVIAGGGGGGGGNANYESTPPFSCADFGSGGRGGAGGGTVAANGDSTERIYFVESTGGQIPVSVRAEGGRGGFQPTLGVEDGDDGVGGRSAAEVRAAPNPIPASVDCECLPAGGGGGGAGADGGAAGGNSERGAGGGGGSSKVTGAIGDAMHTQGAESGNGRVVISYKLPLVNG
jgi:hypothetical protein